MSDVNIDISSLIVAVVFVLLQLSFLLRTHGSRLPVAASIQSSSSEHRMTEEDKKRMTQS